MTSQDYLTLISCSGMSPNSSEEEKLLKSVIDKLTPAGKKGEGLYFIDKELSYRYAELIARAATLRRGIFNAGKSYFLRW